MRHDAKMFGAGGACIGYQRPPAHVLEVDLRSFVSGSHAAFLNVCFAPRQSAPGRSRLPLRRVSNQPGSLLREREIAAISTLVFDSCRSRCPSDLSKSAEVQLSKSADISGDYKFRTKTAKYRASEKNAGRERISDLSASLTVQRFAD
jgi:hypothetical protein